MGSTFKLFPTAAALDKGKASFRSSFDASQPLKIGRSSISDFLGKNRVLTLPEVFIYSSNIGTARLAALLGTADLRRFYERFGFFEQVSIDLPERGTPLYP